MSATQAGQVRRGGLPGWSAVVEGDVGLHVVLVAAPGVDGAAGEHTVPIAQDHLFARRRGWVVGIDRTGGVHVENRADGDSGGAFNQSRSNTRVAGPSFS